MKSNFHQFVKVKNRNFATFEILLFAKHFCNSQYFIDGMPHAKSQTLAKIRFNLNIACSLRGLQCADARHFAAGDEDPNHMQCHCVIGMASCSFKRGPPVH